MNIRKTKKINITYEDKKNLIDFFKNGKIKKNLSTKIKKSLKDIENNGSVILKNFPISNNYFEDFKKFSSLFGVLHKQNKNNDQIIKIENKGNKWTARNRGYTTSSKLDPHTDGGKISLLLCIKNSLIGGENFKLDADLIFEKIKKNKIFKEKIFNGFKYHTRHEAKSKSVITKKKYPIFYFNNKILHCMYNSKPIMEAMKFTKNKDDLKTINKFNKIINSLKNKYEFFKIKPGEIWIVNNYTVLHGRKKFKDLNEKRLLLRAWVSPKKFIYKGKNILDAYNDR
tara:strand:+ start:601 stop:1452 length:852 start_codon:yes stop_codon:yes gene_type:complete